MNALDRFRHAAAACGVVAVLALSGCTSMTPAEFDAHVAALSARDATPGDWISFMRETSAQVQRWSSYYSGSYCLGGRRFLTTKHFLRCYWCDAWTPSSASWREELPAVDRVFCEIDGRIDRIDADGVADAAGDVWVVAVHGDEIGMLSIRDRAALVVKRPGPRIRDDGTPMPVPPAPEFRRKDPAPTPPR